MINPDFVAALSTIMTFLITVIYLAKREKPRNENREIVFKDYQEYSSYKILAERWHDSDLIGECGVCGMDDVPITLPRSDINIGFTPSPAKCRYCQELSLLTFHLKENSVLPWRKQKKRYHPELIKREKSGYYD